MNDTVKYRHFLGLLTVLVVTLGILVTFPYNLGYSAERENIMAFLLRGWEQEQWQHCWLVLPALGFIVWMGRVRLATLPLSGSWFGLPILILAGLFYFVGYRVDNIYFGYAALQVVVPGTILWLGGWNVLWKLAFPILFMVFLWPLMFLEQAITFPLRMIMSNAAAIVLNGLGFDVIRQGTGLISAPDPALGIPAGARFSVDVADPCSGIRSLFALMMVSALYGYFTLKTWWQRLALFVCSVPLAIAGNLVRILILTLGTVAFGAEFAIGKHALTDPSWFHMAAGYAVFAVALGGMIVIGWLLGNARDLPAMARDLISKAGTPAPDPTQSAPPDATPEPTASAGSTLPAKHHYRDDY